MRGVIDHCTPAMPPSPPTNPRCATVEFTYVLPPAASTSDSSNSCPDDVRKTPALNVPPMRTFLTGVHAVGYDTPGWGFGKTLLTRVGKGSR